MSLSLSIFCRYLDKHCHYLDKQSDRAFRCVENDYLRDSSLARSLVSQGWSREKSRSRKKTLETLRDPTLQILQIPNQLFFSALKTRFSASELYVGIIHAEIPF
jgi:hypothetical protein